MTVLVIENNLFKQMQSYRTLECNQKERQQMKHTFIARIKEKVSLRWNRANKLLQVIDEIIYKATDRGYSFNGRETLAKKCQVSIRTVDKAIKTLKESNEVIVAYRHNPSSNGFKTPIIFLKGHEYFKYWKSLLKIEDSIEGKVDESINTDESKVKSAKQGSYLSNTNNKQERYNNRDLSEDKIVRYVVNRVCDSMKKGTKIKYLSSYINRVVKSLENQALYSENIRLSNLRRQKEQELSRSLEVFGLKQRRKPIPFYNWLKD